MNEENMTKEELLTRCFFLDEVVAERNEQIEKMKCCGNCKHHSFWGDELKCNFLSYDEELECMKDKHEWELAE